MRVEIKGKRIKGRKQALKLNIGIVEKSNVCYTPFMGNHRAGRLPSISEGLTLQTSSSIRRALPMMITYSDLVQTGIFIVALIGLCYTIFKGKRK